MIDNSLYKMVVDLSSQVGELKGKMDLLVAVNSGLGIAVLVDLGKRIIGHVVGSDRRRKDREVVGGVVRRILANPSRRRRVPARSCTGRKD